MGASVSTSSSWRSDGQSSKIDSPLMSRPKSSRGLHNGGISSKSERDLTVDLNNCAMDFS